MDLAHGVKELQVHLSPVLPSGPGQCVSKEFCKNYTDQSLSCAVPYGQVHSSQKQMYPKSHEPHLPWATTAPGLLRSPQPCPPATCDSKDRKIPLLQLCPMLASAV